MRNSSPNYENISESNQLYSDSVSSTRTLQLRNLDGLEVNKDDILIKMYVRISNEKYKITILKCMKIECLIIHAFNKNIKFLKYV